jgi:hypothetical protein
MSRKQFLIIMSLVSICIVLLLIFIFTITARAADRCRDFIPDIRSNSIRYLGLDYPYWYNIGCAMTETNCRQDIISFDGGVGLFQLTPSTGILAVIGKEFPVNPSIAENNIRAQAFYIHIIRDKYMMQKSLKFKSKYQIEPLTFTNKCGSRLSDIYRNYNGGYWFLWESKLADPNYTCDEKEMRKSCVRGGTWVGTKNPRWLSFCEVNYSYAEKVYKYGQKYKVGKDGSNYW